jgi:hypothetical protein
MPALSVHLLVADTGASSTAVAGKSDVPMRSYAVTDDGVAKEVLYSATRLCADRFQITHTTIQARHRPHYARALTWRAVRALSGGIQVGGAHRLPMRRRATAAAHRER